MPRNAEAWPHLRKMRHVGATRDPRDCAAELSISAGELSKLRLRTRGQGPVSLQGLGLAHRGPRGGGMVTVRDTKPTQYLLRFLSVGSDDLSLTLGTGTKISELC
jgi:hypothetical protein